jgi:hypothetical protein
MLCLHHVVDIGGHDVPAFACRDELGYRIEGLR